MKVTFFVSSHFDQNFCFFRSFVRKFKRNERTKRNFDFEITNEIFCFEGCFVETKVKIYFVSFVSFEIFCFDGNPNLHPHYIEKGIRAFYIAICGLHWCWKYYSAKIHSNGKEVKQFFQRRYLKIIVIFAMLKCWLWI